MEIERFREVFKRSLPDFRDFENPGQTYLESEYTYKQRLSSQAHELFGDWIGQAVDTLSPQEFTTRLNRLLRGKIPGTDVVQNLAGWRDNSIFFDEILADENQTRRFMAFLHGLLKEAGDPGRSLQALGMLLKWLEDRDCPPSLTKVFPSFFLFVWDPVHHFFIKPRAFDRFLRELGEKPLGSGYRLTPEEYRRVLSVMERLGKALADWRPQNMIDLHSFFWIVMNQAEMERQEIPSKDGAGEVVPDRPATAQPAQRVELPLNLILYGRPGPAKPTNCRRS